MNIGNTVKTSAGWELLGVGRQAEVFAIDKNECIKLFYPDCPDGVVETEARRMRFVCEHGVPSPRFIGLERVDGRYGIRMERLDGITLLRDALEFFKPEVDYGGLLGSIQRVYHHVNAAGLPDMADSLEWHIMNSDALTLSAKEGIVKRLKAMPRGDRLTHMDYHSDNVITTPDGVRIIDWASASCGNPLADAARTLLTMELSSYPADAGEETIWWIDQTRELCREGYLRGYGATARELDEMNEWKPIIAASRLSFCPKEEREQNERLVLECLAR